MKNITVSVDDETYLRARARAAEQGTSVSRVVRDNLVTFAAEPTEHETRREKLLALYAKVDARMKGLPAEPHDPDWRQKMYDERFDDSKLGRRLRGEDV